MLQAVVRDMTLRRVQVKEGFDANAEAGQPAFGSCFALPAEEDELDRFITVRPCQCCLCEQLNMLESYYLIALHNLIL